MPAKAKPTHPPCMRSVIAQAAKRSGLSESIVRENISYLESLLPDLQPNLDKMRAGDWVKLIANVQRVAATVIVLKGAFPAANVSAVSDGKKGCGSYTLGSICIRARLRGRGSTAVGVAACIVCVYLFCSLTQVKAPAPAVDHQENTEDAVVVRDGDCRKR